MSDRIVDLLFPVVCLASSVFIAVGSLGLEDQEARNRGLEYSATMLTVAGATYQINIKHRRD